MTWSQTRAPHTYRGRYCYLACVTRDEGGICCTSVIRDEGGICCTDPSGSSHKSKLWETSATTVKLCSKQASSILDVTRFFCLRNPSSRTTALGLLSLQQKSVPGISGTYRRSDGWYSCQPHRHLWADCVQKVGASTSHKTVGLHGLLQVQLYLLKVKTAVYIFSLCSYPSSQTFGC
jgi:hypothetical protein